MISKRIPVDAMTGKLFTCESGPCPMEEFSGRWRCRRCGREMQYVDEVNHRRHPSANVPEDSHTSEQRLIMKALAGSNRSHNGALIMLALLIGVYLGIAIFLWGIV